MLLALLLAVATAESARSIPPSASSPVQMSQMAKENAALSAAVKSEGETKATEALEPAALKASGGRVLRNGTGLRLHLSAGRDLVLQNQSTSPPPDDKFEQECVSYSLIADLKSRGVYVVSANYYEGGDYLVIDDRSGQQTKVGAPPQFGPDPARFLTIDNNEAYGDGSIVLWERQKGLFREVWRDQHGDNAAHVQEWKQPGVIKLKLDPIGGEPPLQRSTATIVKERDWHFLGPKP
jgi:hypothetical protein